MLKRYSSDLMASVVVFLVALPLCMGIALASGMPPAAGLVTGIIGGIVVGLLSGSPLQVSGPAAGLAVLVWDLLQKHGMEGLAVIIVLSGLLQLLAGIFKFGRWFQAVSPPVIYGMLAGIGVLIVGSQVHVMMDSKPVGGGLQNLLAIPATFLKALEPGTAHFLAAMLGFCTLLVILAWNRWRPERLAWVPAPLVGVGAASLAAAVGNASVQYVQVPMNILDALNFPGLPAFANALRPEILVAALALAFIASAETLLSAAAVDRMHNGPRTQYDKELGAQGIGNLLCGLVGALPMTGVIVRSSANVQAGAKTRASAVLHGLWLLALIVLLPGLLGRIPLAALAGVLVFVGIKLVDLKVVDKMKKFGRFEVFVYAATLTTVVVADLLTGVLLGLGLSTARLLYVLSHLDLSLTPAPRSRMELHFRGAATFLTLPRLSETLEEVPTGSELHIHLGDLAYVDHACIEYLGSWAERHRSTGGEVVMEWGELMARALRPVPTRLSA